MRRMSLVRARRWSALSIADLEPRSRRSFGVQTRIDLSRIMRFKMPALRSRFGPRRGRLASLIFVGMFWPNLRGFLSEKDIHFSDKFMIPQARHLLVIPKG